MEPIKPDLTIVYEKYTEEAANFFSGSLANKYTCNTLKDTILRVKRTLIQIITEYFFFQIN